MVDSVCGCPSRAIPLLLMSINKTFVLLMQLKFEEERAGRRFPAEGVIYTSVAFPSQYDTYVGFLSQYADFLHISIQDLRGFPISICTRPLRNSHLNMTPASQLHMRQVGLKCPAVMNSNHSQLKKKTNKRQERSVKKVFKIFTNPPQRHFWELL